MEYPWNTRITKDVRFDTGDPALNGALSADDEKLRDLGAYDEPRVNLPTLQDLTYGPLVYFARLRFFNFVTPDGPHIGDLTPALEHYARDGWRPVGVWTSGSDGTWLEVLMQRERRE